MAARLHLTIGLVAEQDRLGSTADSILVTQPATGSRARSKGSLYVLAAARIGSSRRSSETTQLVAETIRREYYYDESAGIPVCLEKAIRAANRKLRSGREGQALSPGSIGLALAVIRGNELYLATSGDAEAYLVRQARLLMPDQQRGDGLPTPDAGRVDVWRGEMAVGDSLVLVARNLVEVVGTEELKNALVTLHPQSAVEHLHHLFVAAGGEGSDALMAVEATEGTAVRQQRGFVAVGAAASGSEGPTGLEPDGGGGAGAAAQVSARARDAREAVGGALYSVVDRVTEVLPRGGGYRRISPTASRRETQRKAAIAIVALLGFVAVLGIGLWLLNVPRDQQISETTTGEEAIASVTERLERAFDDDQIADDPEAAEESLALGWAELARAEESGVPLTEIQPLRAQVAQGLDQLRAVDHTGATTVADFTDLDAAVQPAGLVSGPDSAAYAIDGSSDRVIRADLTTGAVVTIINPGDGPGSGIGRPSLLSAGGPDLLVLDHRGGLWRWRPSDATGRGTLSPVRIGGEAAFGDDIRDIGTFLISESEGTYNLYVVDPSERQIQRYQPTADRSGFSAPTAYLATETDVSDFRQLVIDGDIYVLTGEGVDRYRSGSRQGDFELATPPDDGDLRPGHRFEAIAGSAPDGRGALYLWDAEHARIIVYQKQDGAYVRQFVGLDVETPFEELQGMFVTEPEEETQPTVLYWLRGQQLLSSELVDEGAPDAEGSPGVGATTGSDATPDAGATGSTDGPTGETPGSTESTTETP